MTENDSYGVALSPVGTFSTTPALGLAGFEIVWLTTAAPVLLNSTLNVPDKVTSGTPSTVAVPVALSANRPPVVSTNATWALEIRIPLASGLIPPPGRYAGPWPTKIVTPVPANALTVLPFTVVLVNVIVPETVTKLPRL